MKNPVANRLQSIPNWVLILTSGILTVAAFPPLPLGFLAYVSLVPLMLLFMKEDYHLGFEKGYLFGLLLNLGIMYWLAFNEGTQWHWAMLSMIAAVLYLALNYGLIGFLVGIIGRRWGARAGLWSWPVVWVAVEVLRSYGKNGIHLEQPLLFPKPGNPADSIRVPHRTPWSQFSHCACKCSDSAGLVTIGQNAPPQLPFGAGHSGSFPFAASLWGLATARPAGGPAVFQSPCGPDPAQYRPQ